MPGKIIHPCTRGLACKLREQVAAGGIFNS